MSALAATQTDDMPPPAPVPAARATEVPAEAPDLVAEFTTRGGAAMEALGLAPGPSSVTETEVMRVSVGTNTRFTVSEHWSWKDHAGARDPDGAKHVGSHEEAKAENQAAWERDLSEPVLVPMLLIAQKAWKLRGLIADDGDTVLAEWRPTAYFKRHCEGCGGHGKIGCNRCARSGQLPCPSFMCRGGRTQCSGCGGRGQVRYGTDNKWSYCVQCHGSCWQNCSTCQGDTWIYCTACGGPGVFNCDPCGQTGVLTQIHGFRLDMAHKTTVWHGSLMDQEEVVAWARGGARGSADGVPAGSQPQMGFSAGKLKKFPRVEGEYPRFCYAVEGSVVEAKVAAEAGAVGIEYVGWCTRLERARVTFKAFLDERAREVAGRLDDAARRLTPSAFRREASDLGGLGTLMEEGQRTGMSAADTEAAAAELFRSSISPDIVKALAATQATCLSRFGATAARAGWKWPARLLPVVVAAPFLMDFPWAAYNPLNQTPTVVAAIALIVAVAATVGAAEALGRRAVRAEVGSSKSFRPNVARRRMAAAAAAVAAAGVFAPYAGVEALPFRRATHEFREIVGLPHLNCMQPRAKVVADGCSIER